MTEQYEKALSDILATGKTTVDGVEIDFGPPSVDVEYRTPTRTDANGLVWLDGGVATDDHLAFGGHEPSILEIAKGMLPERGAFLDVGAHVGLYSLNMAMKAGTVYAVEANPDTYERLVANMHLNGSKHDCEIRAVNCAAWDDATLMRLVDENDKQTGGSTHIEPLDPKQSRYAQRVIKTLPLDALLDDIPALDLVKIDVEGAEAHVLRGMRRTILRFGPTLLIEMHDEIYNKPEVRKEVCEFLMSVDYEWSDTLRWGIQYYFVAKPNFHDEPEFEIEIVKAGEG